MALTKQNILTYMTYKNNPNDQLFIDHPEYKQVLIADGLVNADGTIIDVPLDEEILLTAIKDLDDSPIVINVKEFTDKVTTIDLEDNEFKPDLIVSGEGIFDELMNTATKHLKAQFDSNRIRDEDYATAYIAIYQATLQAAIQVWLQKGVAEKQLELVTAQVASEESKRDLYRRQIEGFDEDYKQKILKIMLDTWSVALSVSRDIMIPPDEPSANYIPAAITKVAIDDLFNDFIFPELDIYKYGRPMLESGIVTP